MSKQYLVGVREVHISTRKVWAKDENEAKLKAGQAEEIMLEYSYSLDQEFWSIEEEEHDE